MSNLLRFQYAQVKKRILFPVYFLILGMLMYYFFQFEARFWVDAESFIHRVTTRPIMGQLNLVALMIYFALLAFPVWMVGVYQHDEYRKKQEWVLIRLRSRTKWWWGQFFYFFSLSALLSSCFCAVLWITVLLLDPTGAWQATAVKAVLRVFPDMILLYMLALMTFFTLSFFYLGYYTAFLSESLVILLILQNYWNDWMKEGAFTHELIVLGLIAALVVMNLKKINRADFVTNTRKD